MAKLSCKRHISSRNQKKYYLINKILDLSGLREYNLGITMTISIASCVGDADERGRIQGEYSFLVLCFNS
jgi:hypothetical protein